METFNWLFVLDAAFWVIVALLSAVSIRSAVLSDYELGRRSKAGEAEAARLQAREALLPRLHTIRRVSLAVVLVIAIAVAIASLGWVIGVLVATLLSLLLGTIARFKVVSRTSDRLYIGLEPKLLEIAERSKWLDALRGTAAIRPDVMAASKDELGHIIEHSAHVLTRSELLRVRAGLTLDNHVVEDIMTPVSVVDIAEASDSLGPLVIDTLHKTGHSRFPVTDGDVHHIVGMLYLHDIINLKSAKSTVREAMDPRVHYIHEAQSLEHALTGFLRTHRHLFIVVNDFRETVGVLALEDVLETLLGKKIVDEFDAFDDLRAVAANNPRKNNIPKGRVDI